MHTERLSPGSFPPCKGNRHPKEGWGGTEAVMRLKKNGTYCSEWSKLCWGRQLQEKTEVVSSFGLWKVPGR